MCRLAAPRRPGLSRAGIALRAAALLLAATLDGGAAAPDLSRLPPAAARPVDFAAEVRPLFEAKCFSCHGPARQRSGFRLDVKAAALAGGERGPAILPGRGADSPLLHFTARLVEGMEMPPKGGPLSDAELGLLRAWIDQGAPWPDGLDTPGLADPRDHWAFQPLAPAEPPAVRRADWPRNDVDRFILARLEQAGLAPSPEANRRTLIRRLHFNLHGLPPAPEEVAAFVADPDPRAYERLVDRLLESPRYGERWARHWLDAVHYGDSHGYDKDKPRPHAWPYRDYVIRAFNADKPYARFVQEQLAGDVLFPDDPDGVAALGFIAAGPWDYVGHVELPESKTDGLIARYNDRDDMVMTAMATFVSLTVHCARCHDHKFDPIPQREYYALQAVFAGVDRADRPFDPDPAVHRGRQALLREQRALEARLAAVRHAPPGKPRGEEDALGTRLCEVQHALWALPAPALVYAAASDFRPEGSFKPPRGPRPVHNLRRGDVKSPGELMAPGALSCFPGLPAALDVPDAGDEGARRAALARWLADPRNFALRRSIVNRVWHHHFGRGLVDTPNDFGRMGSPPSHPELLDWLAAWFEREGGSLKKLHRLLVTSAAWRQASGEAPGPAPPAAADSDNRLLGRMNRARLDAESLRDAILAVSGRLDLTMGGPAARHFAFKDDHSPVYDYEQFDPDDPAGRRRSIYRFIVRSVPDPFMDTMDCPDPSVLTPARSQTLTPLQALALLNNPWVLRQAEHFAARVEAEAATPEARIRRAVALAFQREAEAEETARLAAYSQRHGLAATCRLLFNSSEFVFVD